MKITVVCLVGIIFCNVSDCRTLIASYSSMDKHLQDLGAKEDYIRQFHQDFSQLKKLYCDPKDTNEAKLKAAQDCSVGEPKIASAVRKCADQVYSGLNPVKIRDMECEGGRAYHQTLEKMKMCVDKELGDDDKNNGNNRDPANRPQLDSKAKSEILQKLMKSTDDLRECYKKALS